MERMRVVHTLRNVPASRPGEPHQRSQEQLALLAKLLRNTPELKGFEPEAPPVRSRVHPIFYSMSIKESNVMYV